ncbi:TetR family transcriptional regulator C-terminal domain-containing protein [Lipingzhangella sp. LS1_29]|uniref:TetR family transcriptional regulator C-terminal domain-containing protein n=1 Tax=Lipingzhangella rawalii TaxID=2055835 RepID=A0ABU2H5M5_9ACTN|nr:TetR family transcriptional regulator C-terminal domain-containing protein [Lipingzhangella rawalii]MDS1270612.1 TetR family transcriptional regulator C-terminal domain-containing protein [Lipingzhangella rawalii]
MPKVVDHEQRRLDLAAAAWRVAARDGAQAISIRSVATEAGWSAGALRHYFPSRGHLVTFTIRHYAQAIVERIKGQVAEAQAAASLVEGAALLAEELLPLDEQRRTEFALWAAAGEETRSEAALAITDLSDSLRGMWRQLATHLCGYPNLANPERPHPDPRVEQWAEFLHVFVDGLATQLMYDPRRTPAQARRALRDFLATVPILAPDDPPPPAD